MTPDVIDSSSWRLLRASASSSGPAQWASEGEYLRSQIKSEIFDQAFGVERGDQIELQRDPVIIKALEILGS